MPVSVMSCCMLVKLGLLKGMKSKYVSEATTELQDRFVQPNCLKVYPYHIKELVWIFQVLRAASAKNQKSDDIVGSWSHRNHFKRVLPLRWSLLCYRLFQLSNMSSWKGILQRMNELQFLWLRQKRFLRHQNFELPSRIFLFPFLVPHFVVFRVWKWKKSFFIKSHISQESFIFLLTKYEKNIVGHIKYH